MNQQRNPADGGNGGNIFVAARTIKGNGKIITNGGDAAPGGKPGRAGTITLISELIEGNSTLEARGGNLPTLQGFLSKNIYVKIGTFVVGFATVVGTIVAVWQLLILL